MRGALRGGAVVLLCTVAVAGFVLARHRGDRDGTLNDALGRVERCAIGTASVVSSTGVVREDWRVRAAWDLELDEPWASYVDRTRRALVEQGFALVNEQTDRIALARSIPGDAFSVGIAALSTGVPMRVRVSFEATPD